MGHATRGGCKVWRRYLRGLQLCKLQSRGSGGGRNNHTDTDQSSVRCMRERMAVQRGCQSGASVLILAQDDRRDVRRVAVKVVHTNDRLGGVDVQARRAPFRNSSHAPL